MQFDGNLWYCDCPSWVFNTAHAGENIPRECKHTHEALRLMNTRGASSYREIAPIGPRYEELQEYVSALVELTKNGKVSQSKCKTSSPPNLST